MIDLPFFSRQAQAICDAGRFLYQQGWSPATSSNYSARLNAEHFAVTVSGRHKGQLTPADVMAVDLQGQPVQSEARPSAETRLHAVLYEWRDDIGAVLHTHSIAGTVVSRLQAGDALILEDYELQKAFAGVATHEGQLCLPIFDNTQDIETLAKETLNYLMAYPETPAYLIRGHGIYTWGRDMAETLRHIEALEFLLACELATLRAMS